MANKTGKLVETKFGLGYTKNSDDPINGKIPVYLNCPLEGGPRKILCNPKNIKIIGYYD